MHPTRTTDGVRVGGPAPQQLHHARGYGHLIDGEVHLAPVEAAYLCYRGDIDPIDGMAYDTYLSSLDHPTAFVRFLVYKDLRERGYYLAASKSEVLEVFERGTMPADRQVAFTARVLDEATSIPVSALEPGVLAIVDAEGEVGYLRISRQQPSGTVPLPDQRGIPATAIGDRFLIPEPPSSLYEAAFYGQPVGGREATEGALQLSGIETRYLTDKGVVAPDSESSLPSTSERAYRVYRTLRDAGVVTKTGYKFGTDFRLYPEFSGLDSLSHSSELVHVYAPTDTITPRRLSLHVRLAHGVGKRMLLALQPGSDDRSTEWVSVTRETP